MTARAWSDAKQRVKDRLNEYIDIKQEREQILKELRKLDADMTALTSPNLDGMPKSGRGSDRLERMIDRKAALRRYYEEQAERLDEAQQAIEGMISGLSSRERKILRCKYIEGMTWEQVCVAVSYSWRQTHNIHSAALDKLVERMEAQHAEG